MSAIASTASSEFATVETSAAPRFFETYGLSYALGLLFLLPAIVLIGSQPLYSFTLFYTLMLTIPPVAASVLVLVLGATPSEQTGSLVGRAALLTVLATIGSILALIFGTPVVIFLFLNGVGHSQALTGLISAAGLALVSSPMVYALVRSVRSGSWSRAFVLALGIFAMVIVIALTTAQGGFLVESMRRDQGEIMMGLLEWCLPAFAVTTAFVRSHRLV